MENERLEIPKLYLEKVSLPTKICLKLTSRLKPACLSRVFTASLCCVPGNRHKASCKICHKTFDIVNIGESAIGSHANRKFHSSYQGGKSQELQ